MNFQSYYKPYCSSWLKFGGAVISPSVIASGIVMAFGNHTHIIKHVTPPITAIIWGAYHAHNLYAEYQYNKSLEAELTVEIESEIYQVKASPSYFNWYTGYNVLSIIAHAIHTTGVQINQTEVAKCGSCVALMYKLISLQDDYVQYNFTDMKTGMPISPEEMEYLNILDVKYINVQYSESHVDDPISCDHIHELEIDNPVMEAAA